MTAQVDQMVDELISFATENLSEMRLASGLGAPCDDLHSAGPRASWRVGVLQPYGATGASGANKRSGRASGSR